MKQLNQINLRVDAELKEQFAELAKSKRTTTAELIKKFMKKELQNG